MISTSGATHTGPDTAGAGHRSALADVGGRHVRARAGKVD